MGVLCSGWRIFLVRSNRRSVTRRSDNSQRSMKQPKPPSVRRRSGDQERLNKNEVLRKRDLRDSSSLSEERRHQAAFAERMMDKLGVKSKKWSTDGNSSREPSAEAKRRLPPVGGASPASARGRRTSSVIQPSVANLDRALANMLETPA